MSNRIVTTYLRGKFIHQRKGRKQRQHPRRSDLSYRVYQLRSRLLVDYRVAALKAFAQPTPSDCGVEKLARDYVAALKRLMAFHVQPSIPTHS